MILRKSNVFPFSDFIMTLALLRVLAICLCANMFLGTYAAVAAEVDKGSVTGFPIPRFASLKSDRVNLREGPSRDHRTTWVFQRAGLPVEIVAEFDVWRRIRDVEGTEGWVLHSLLSGRRTALVAPWAKEKTLPLHEKTDDASDVVAELQPNVLAQIENCDGKWCKLEGRGFKGYMRQERLWGAYPNEIIKD